MDPLAPLSEQAYTLLKGRLMRGEIAPRSLLREAELARQLGMSRTPVREALRRLLAEGFLRAVPQGGFVSVELTREDLMSIYPVRGVLEGLAARLAARNANRVDLARLEELADAMERSYLGGDDAQLAKLNSQFHDAVAQASHNRYLQAMLANIRDVFEGYRPYALIHPGRRDSAHAEHCKLLTALKMRDEAAAAEIAEEHVRRALMVRLEAGDDSLRPFAGERHRE